MDGPRGKDWLRARGHHLCLTDTIFYFIFHSHISYVCFIIVCFTENCLVSLFARIVLCVQCQNSMALRAPKTP